MADWDATATLAAFLAAAAGLAAPLALAALGETVSERAGVINIGMEGSVIWGALGGALGSLAAGPYWGLAVGAMAGCAAALVFAAFAVHLNTDQIITGTAVALGSLGFTGAVFQSRFGVTGVALELETVPAWELPFLSQIPIAGPVLFDRAVTVYFVYVLVPVLWWFLFRTRWGLALRALGEAPEAAQAAGVPVKAARTLAVLFGGLLGGLGGAHMSLVHTGTFSENMSAGTGFVAIAVVVLGRWDPRGVLAAALLFGCAEALQFALQAMDVEFPYPLLLMLPYALSLVALAGGFGRSRAPAALALPWPKRPA